MNRVTTAGSTADVTVRITSVFGKRVASIETNRLDGASLEKAVRDAEALARLSPEDPEYLPEPSRQTYLDVSGYYESTGNLTTEDRGRAASLVLERSKAANTIAAGYIDVFAGSRAVANSNGLFAYHASTAVASTLTIRARRRQFVGLGRRRRRGLDDDRVRADCHRRPRQVRGVAREDRARARHLRGGARTDRRGHADVADDGRLRCALGRGGALVLLEARRRDAARRDGVRRARHDQERPGVHERRRRRRSLRSARRRRGDVGREGRAAGVSPTRDSGRTSRRCPSVRRCRTSS